jgi:hypothetical protein
VKDLNHMRIYVSHNGEEFGPYSVEDLRLDFASGSLLPSDFARHENASVWTPLDVFLNSQLVATSV